MFQSVVCFNATYFMSFEGYRCLFYLKLTHPKMKTRKLLVLLMFIDLFRQEFIRYWLLTYLISFVFGVDQLF